MERRSSGKAGLDQLSSLAAGGDAPQQFLDARYSPAFPFVVEDAFSVHQQSQVAETAGRDPGFDSELLFRCFLQAHGRAAEVPSKETTFDFNLHSLISFPADGRPSEFVRRAPGAGTGTRCSPAAIPRPSRLPCLRLETKRLERERGSFNRGPGFRQGTCPWAQDLAL